MPEKKYLLLLKKQLQEKRVVCGFKQDAYGNAVVTTGIPKQCKEGKTTYVKQKTMSYDEYIFNQMQGNIKRR